MLDGGGAISTLSSLLLSTTVVCNVVRIPFVGEGTVLRLHPFSIAARGDFGRLTNLGLRPKWVLTQRNY